MRSTVKRLHQAALTAHSFEQAASSAALWFLVMALPLRKSSVEKPVFGVQNPFSSPSLPILEDGDPIFPHLREKMGQNSLLQKGSPSEGSSVSSPRPSALPSASHRRVRKEGSFVHLVRSFILASLALGASLPSANATRPIKGPPTAQAIQLADGFSGKTEWD